MALQFQRAQGGEESPPFLAPVRLCVDETRERIVPCDSTEARFLLAAEGTPVSAADVERYGLAAKAAPEPEPAPEPKAKPRHKAVKGPPEDKGRR